MGFTQKQVHSPHPPYYDWWPNALHAQLPPDGTKVYFFSWGLTPGGTPGIWTVELDGSYLTKIIDSEAIVQAAGPHGVARCTERGTTVSRPNRMRKKLRFVRRELLHDDGGALLGPNAAASCSPRAFSRCLQPPRRASGDTSARPPRTPGCRAPCRPRASGAAAAAAASTAPRWSARPSPRRASPPPRRPADAGVPSARGPNRCPITQYSAPPRGGCRRGHLRSGVVELVM